jgi:hypothetical protein
MTWATGMQELLDHLLKATRPHMEDTHHVYILVIVFMAMKSIATRQQTSKQGLRRVYSALLTMFQIWTDYRASPIYHTSLKEHPEGNDFTPDLIGSA